MIAPVTPSPSPSRTTDLSDKLTLITQALINTGYNTVAVADDNSDEWRVASSGFDQWSLTLLYNFEDRFSSNFITLVRVGTSPYPGFQDIYDKPNNCLFLRTVYRADQASLVFPAPGVGMPTEDTRPPDLEYRLVNDQIHCVAPFGAICIYTPFPVGSQPWSVGFTDALRFCVEATCLSGLNEDFGEAAKRLDMAEKAAALASSRDQNQEPRRVMFRSGVLERRRSRGWGFGGGRR